MAGSIHPDQLRRALNDGEEFALLDVRERGRYARAHLFLAINVPLSHLELRMRRYVPRYSVRVLLCDEGNGFSERAEEIMGAAGYTDVSVIKGGVYNCAAAGFELFRGHYTVTYAFGLYVGQRYGTPAIAARTLKTKMDSNEALVVLDSRSIDEFCTGSIPGSINVPLAELPYRIHDVAPDPTTQVVVNCGAVTRGILGGQSLIEAGVANPVRVLTNGVRGWDLTGLELRRGASGTAGEASAESAAWAAGSAQRLSEAAGIKFMTGAELTRWREDKDRTLYVVDVRTWKEYQAGHLPGAIWILGGELVGLYEDHIGTLNARFCLVDDNGARAILTASWLNRMGWPHVAVLQGGIGDFALVSGPEIEDVPELEQADVATVSPEALAGQIEEEIVLVLDFASSSIYEQAHIPGAWWTLRSNLAELIHKLPAADKVVATCPDGRLARLAAMDLGRLTELPVAVLAGGTAAWRARGRELTTGLTRTLGEVDDVSSEFVIRPDDDRITARAAQLRMVRWQEELLERLDRDQTFTFSELPLLTPQG